MKRSSKGSEKGSNGDESPSSPCESESPTRQVQIEGAHQMQNMNYQNVPTEQGIELIDTDNQSMKVSTTGLLLRARVTISCWSKHSPTHHRSMSQYQAWLRLALFIIINVSNFRTIKSDHLCYYLQKMDSFTHQAPCTDADQKMHLDMLILLYKL